MGADAVVPYLIFEATLIDANLTLEEKIERVKNTLKALRSGIEKCTSTMGIHESRGYGRLFASLGLSTSIALALGTKNYAGSEQGGLKWEDLDADSGCAQSCLSQPWTRRAFARQSFLPEDLESRGQTWKARVRLAGL